MTLDGLTLHTAVAELQKTITNAKVQKVLMPAKAEIVLQLYSAASGNARLCISADAGDCALYLTETAKKNPATPPPFCMFLRKYLVGAVVTSIEQSGLNRVVTIAFSARDELMRQVELRLIVEIMGKYSNIILTDRAGKILDSVRRVSADISSKRQVLSGVQYEEPPQHKLNPLELTFQTLKETLITKKDTRIVSHITSMLDGISSQTAVEILQRAGVEQEFTVDLNQKQIARIAETMKTFLRQVVEHPQPCIQFNQDGLPVFFSCIPYETYPEEARRFFGSCNGMLDFYYTRRAELFRISQQKESLTKQVGKELSRVEKRIRIYRDSIDDLKRAEKTQRRADSITANIYRLKKGVKEFEAVDYETGEPVMVSLDVSLHPQELAQKLYKKVAKYKKAASLNTTRLEQALEEEEFLLGALHYIENADTAEDIIDIKQSLIKADYLSAPPKGKAEARDESQPLHFTTPAGMEVLVGKNDRQNDALTMRVAAKEDIWFHAQKIPGSHVLLITKGVPLEEIDDESIVFAASLAAQYSRAKQSGKTPVDYAYRKNVKKPPGARPGKVIYDDYFTVYVDADKKL